MKNHKIEIVLENGDVKEMTIDSNDKTTAITVAMNRLEEEVKQNILSVTILETVEEETRRLEKKKEDEYLKRAKKIYEQRQQNEIERIVNDLKEKDAKAERKKIQDACPHTNTYRTNHGYHEYCSECGLDLPWK